MAENVLKPLSPYPDIQALVRGLDILRALNSSPKGRATITQLARQTGIHRTTVKRILETLIRHGYVATVAGREYYYVTLRVRDLSDGFTDQEWVSAIATPAMGELLERVKWPSDLSTLDGSHMLIRESTHRFSPLSFERGMVGKRMPVLLTASGRAYLAACSDTEREEIIRIIQAEGGAQAALARNPKLIGDLVEQVRARGYAVNEGDWHPDSPTGILALPIHHENNVIACLNVIYVRRNLPHAAAAQRYLPALKETVNTIERRLASANGIETPATPTNS